MFNIALENISIISFCAFLRTLRNAKASQERNERTKYLLPQQIKTLVLGHCRC